VAVRDPTSLRWTCYFSERIDAAAVTQGGAGRGRASQGAAARRRLGLGRDERALRRVVLLDRAGGARELAAHRVCRRRCGKGDGDRNVTLRSVAERREGDAAAARCHDELAVGEGRGGHGTVRVLLVRVPEGSPPVLRGGAPSAGGQRPGVA